jgi:hypothetical protein
VQGEHEECQNIRTQAELYGMQVILVKPNTNEDITDTLSV